MTPTMMHACASAAKLRGGGPILKAGIAAMGESGTPPPRTVIANPSRPSGRERSHNLGRKHQRVSSIRRRDAAVHLRARRRRARGATARSAACVPAPRSTSCASTGHPPFAADTIGRAHCPFGTAETATPTGSCRAARARCPSGPIPWLPGRWPPDAAIRSGCTDAVEEKPFRSSILPMECADELGILNGKPVSRIIAPPPRRWRLPCQGH